MGYVKRVEIPIVLDGIGNFETDTEPLYGVLSSIVFNGTDAFDTADVTIVDSAAQITVYGETISGIVDVMTRAPRRATHSTLGVAATYNGTAARLLPFAFQGRTLNIEIAGGVGEAEGTIHLVLV